MWIRVNSRQTLSISFDLTLKHFFKIIDMNYIEIFWRLLLINLSIELSIFLGYETMKNLQKISEIQILQHSEYDALLKVRFAYFLNGFLGNSLVTLLLKTSSVHCGYAFQGEWIISPVAWIWHLTIRQVKNIQNSCSTPLIIFCAVQCHRIKVSLLGVDSLWGDCTFILADWGS